ncbi:hypothetical protein BGZ83_004867 [Gryganskiella cystojenkinii]|nr:hypothetical protein BGZ83_004867 [Gryganskiella cystojenkinii]
MPKKRKVVFDDEEREDRIKTVAIPTTNLSPDPDMNALRQSLKHLSVYLAGNFNNDSESSKSVSTTSDANANQNPSQIQDGRHSKIHGPTSLQDISASGTVTNPNDGDDKIKQDRPETRSPPRSADPTSSTAASTSSSSSSRLCPIHGGRNAYEPGGLFMYMDMQSALMYHYCNPTLDHKIYNNMLQIDRLMLETHRLLLQKDNEREQFANLEWELEAEALRVKDAERFKSISNMTEKQAREASKHAAEDPLRYSEMGKSYLQSVAGWTTMNEAKNQHDEHEISQGLRALDIES